jgi:hypothetical protein
MRCCECHEREAAEEISPEEYAGLCAFCAWQRWFRASTAGFWDTVNCIECELGRHCDVHPDNSETLQ